MSNDPMIKTAAALKANVEKLGFQSFIVVKEGGKPGTYEVIDGHHRWAALESLGRETAPVVVLPKSVSKADADLAMLSFNLSAEILPDEFYELVRDVQAQLGEAELAALTGLNEDFLKQLNVEEPKVLQAPVPLEEPKGVVLTKTPVLLTGRAAELVAVARDTVGDEMMSLCIETALQRLLEQQADA